MSSLATWQLLALALVGALAGFVNTVAGAGSLLSLRALMLFGLPAVLSNGTNRVPVLAQSLVAARGFAKQGKLPRAAILFTAGPACVGALAGALLATVVPEAVMRYVLIVVLFGAGLLGLKKTAPTDARELEDGAVIALCKRPTTVLWLFVAGSYGGFLQAGVGLLLLHALATVAGLDLVRANALKAIVVALFSLVSVAVFVGRGLVMWEAALSMSVGAMVGARAAVAFAIGWADRLKIAVVVVDFVACALLLFW